MGTWYTSIDNQVFFSDFIISLHTLSIFHVSFLIITLSSLSVFHLSLSVSFPMSETRRQVISKTKVKKGAIERIHADQQNDGYISAINPC